MIRRLVVVALLLFMVAPAAVAKRRAVAPPSSCVVGTLVPATYANVLAADEQFVYFVDESLMLARVPRLGGAVETLVESLDPMLPLAMTVDATHLYISSFPIDFGGAQLPGSIIAVPKTGGVVEVLASGVDTAFTLVADETHLYWAAAGILDFDEGEIRPGGKVERMRKNGSERMTLASDLSAPLGLALSGGEVYFGESGLATGDPSVGLYRVAKSGGAITTLNDGILVVALGFHQEEVVVLGGTEEVGVGIFELDLATPTEVRTILEDESLSFNMQLAEGNAYVIAERDATELLAIDLDTPGPARVIRSGLDGDGFILVDCAAVVNTIDGDVIRTAR